MAHPHSNLVRQVDNLEIDVASLAAITAVTGTSRIDAAREQGFRTLVQRGVISVDGTMVAAPTGGPIMVGFSNLDTLDEVEEAIENDPQDMQDTPGVEQAKRFLNIVGYLYPSVEGIRHFAFEHKFRMSAIEGTSILWFAYNTDVTSALPASSQVKIFCEHLGVWLRD